MSGPVVALRDLPPEIEDAELRRWCHRLATPIAVTGATGFIGSHLVDALVRAGLRPRLAVRDRSRLQPGIADRAQCVSCRLEDTPTLESLVAGAGTVLHLAGLVRAPSEAAFALANAEGTSRVVDACRRVAPGARLVHVSSLAAAGPSPTREGRRPDDEPAPVSAYGRSKLAGERVVQHSDGWWTIVRPPAVYGPRDIDILQFFRLVARGVVPLPAGERWITLAHVTDVVRGILAAAGAGQPRRVFHVGHPVPSRMDEVIAALAHAGGVRARCLAVPPLVLRAAGRAGDLLHRCGFRSVALTSDKAGELLARHWTARTEESLAALGLDGCVPLADGATDTWAWYRKHGWVR